MHKKRVGVLHAQVPFVMGGAELLAQNLVNQLKKREYMAEIISLPFKWYPVNELFNSAMAWRMVDIEEANGQKIDLVVATKYPTYVARHENKVLWLLHQHRTAYDLYDKEQWAGLKFIPGGAEARNKLIDIDNKTIIECKRSYTISQNVTDRLKRYNNIDSEKLYHPPLLEGKYKCDSFEGYILSVGRLDGIKRVDLIIKSLKFCDKKIKLNIAGIGPETENLKKLTNELGLSSQVNFLGFVDNDNLVELYANAFAVCFPPLDEDYGYITLESFFSKKPVITTVDSGGPLEFVKNDVNGFIVQPNPEAIGASIQKLYNNKKKCEEFGIRGYEVVKNITWDNVIDKLTETIR